MAYLNTLTPEEQAAQQGPAPAAGFRRPMSSPQGSAFGGVMALLNNNRDAGNQMAQQFTSDVTNEGEKAKTDLGSLQNKFNTGLAAQTYKFDPNIAKDPNQLKAMQSQNFQYSGPGSLSEMPEWSNLAAGANDAQTRAQQLGSTSRGAVLQGRYGGMGGYTGADSAFDSAILGQAAGGKLADLSKTYSGLNNMLRQANDQSATAAQNVQAQNAQVAAQWRDWMNSPPPTRAANNAPPEVVAPDGTRRQISVPAVNASYHGGVASPTLRIIRPRKP